MRTRQCVVILVAAFLALNVFAAAPWWGQWGQNSLHQGSVTVAGQTGSNILGSFVYDPNTSKEQAGAYAAGALLVHYQSALLDGNDVFMEFKTNSFTNYQHWETQTWGERKYSWVNGQLVQQWETTSDWKPVPFSKDKDGPGWEPVYHGVLTSAAIYVPGFGGTILKIDRGTGALLTRINPFSTIDPNTFTVGPLSADSAGNVYYNVMQLDGSAKDPWVVDVPNSWLVKVSKNDSAKAVAWSTLVPGTPAATDQCDFRYSTLALPWPVLNADGTPAPTPRITCGSQRPPVNTAPAIGPDGTIYDISRASLDDYECFLVAVNKDLTPKWTSSMRQHFTDGCGTPFLPPNGAPGGCTAGLTVAGISPPTGKPGDGRVLDDSTSAPVVAPDGSIYYGAYTRYNYAQGHMMRWASTGQYAVAAPPCLTTTTTCGGFQFGWDITPGIASNGTTFAVVMKENHYGDVGSYCNDNKICPLDRTATDPSYPEEYFVSSISPDLSAINWRFKSTNTQSCSRNADGTMSCVSDHPLGFEWCVNAPGIDSTGTVFFNSEDGWLYEVNSSGAQVNRVFTNLAIGAAYTPLSIGPDGKIYTQNDGIMFVIGN